jgi:hypothetical protein
LIRLNAEPGVVHANGDETAIAAVVERSRGRRHGKLALERHAIARLRELHRVRDQVDEDLPHAARVAHVQQPPFLVRDLDRDATCQRNRAADRERVLDGFVDRILIALETHLTRVDGREIEYLVDQPEQVCRAPA